MLLRGPRIVLEVALVRLATLLAATLTALGPTTACGNPDADAWESLISRSGQVEKELEELDWEYEVVLGHNSGSTLPQCAVPTWESMLNEVSPVDLGDLSRELDRWQEYAQALADAGAGREVQLTASWHLTEIQVDVQGKRQAFDGALETLEWLNCPVYYPWK